MTKRLKIGLYSPYINIYGGGERYLLTIAKYLSNQHDVDIYQMDDLLIKAYQSFGISLDKVNLHNDNLFQQTLSFKKYNYLQKLDVLFFMTDGSIFFSNAKKNFLIIQSPDHIPFDNIVNRIKLSNWQIICYSQFVKKIIAEKIHKSSIILSPCIGIDKYNNTKKLKKNIILSVGRFFPYPHNKKHDILIKIFKNFFSEKFKNWELVIAGFLTERGGESIYRNLVKSSFGYPIKIYKDLSFDELTNLYKQAKIYWHATGFNEDLLKYPQRAEHFGITTLEAMAAGCIPLSYEGGGQVELIKDGVNGYLWKTESELVAKTVDLISTPGLLQNISKNALISTANYSCEKFYDQLKKILNIK